MAAKQNGDACGCSICRDKRGFELPPDLYHAFVHGTVVVFAGAGISTENRNVFPYTLYDDICTELRGAAKRLPFPDVMSKYCSRPNGRAKLLRKIRDRFDYVRSFPELYRAATRFHQELSTLPVAQNIVTTNWDCYFEQQCGATPFVSGEDFTFWEMPGRKVFKIHGSVDSYGSIVATREDYESCYARLATGLLGSALKMMLATKTIVYIGFSFIDDDFVRLHEIVTSEMHGLRPQSYIVTLDRSSEDRFRANGLTPIYTDGTFFIASVKHRLTGDRYMLADERFNGVADFLDRVLAAHDRLIQTVDPCEYPDVIYALSYQDGLIHALERILSLKRTGYYSHACNVRNKVKTYLDRVCPRELKNKRYHEVAYAEGYADGHLFLLADDRFRRGFPLYYVSGTGYIVRSLKEYRRVLVKEQQRSTSRHRFATMLVEKNRLGGATSFHHTPFLL